MLGRAVRDETGIVLPLAVIMIVLIGVMGAGVLVFVQSDLGSVVEVNKGQKALDIGDAGIQLAKRQLLADKVRGHYDVDSNTNANYYTADCNVTDESTDPPLIGDNWSPEVGGVTKTFAGGQFNVTIRWMSPSSSDNKCKAPVASPPTNVDYFQVISTGTFSGAKRKIESIYRTYDLDVPRAYYTPGDITIAGTANISNVSIFSLGNVTINTNSTITGTDLAYGNWCNPPFNTTPRGSTAPCTSSAGGNANAGIGAVGTISNKVSGRDFDTGTTPKFITKSPPDSSQTSGQISFPFDYTTQTGQQDADRLDFLREEAKRQGNYNMVTTTGTQSLTSWPTNSSYNTVVFYEYATANSTNNLNWSVSGSCSDNPAKRGTLVVVNGNFSTQPNKALFRGVVIVRGGEFADGTSSDTGNTCLDGFVNASGNIKISGTVTPSTSLETSSRPGFHGVKLWSWRELYQ